MVFQCHKFEPEVRVYTSNLSCSGNSDSASKDSDRLATYISCILQISALHYYSNQIYTFFTITTQQKLIMA